MGKLYFRYGCMNSSKSANLLMIKYNYEEQNLKVLLLKPSIDTREAVVKSRIGIESDCILFDEDCDLIQLVKNQPETDVILVDEAQFCSEEQIDQLWRISVQARLPGMWARPAQEPCSASGRQAHPAAAMAAYRHPARSRPASRPRGAMSRTERLLAQRPFGGRIAGYGRRGQKCRA